ncbi:MAG TPA: dihydroneopterin aldolase [Chloroflexota bacterium]|nr:dihydroneopterin aldolase [Chloroflexota bacterium]
MDSIFLEGLTFYGYHGVNPEELRLGQRFVVSVTLGLNLAAAGRADDLAQTVNYATLYAMVRDIVEGPPVRLLETLGERITGVILDQTPAEEVVVRIEKPWAPVKGMVAGTAGVTVARRRSC